MKTQKLLRDALFFLVISVLVSTQVFGIIPAYLDLIGDTQGRIEGSSQLERRDGMIAVYLFEQDISLDIDSTTRLPSGRLLTNPITILKEIDKSSPLLYQALIDGENLEFELRWYKINPNTRQEEHYFTIYLRDSIITSIKPWMSDTLNPANQYLRHMENISFAYSEIEWVWELDDSGGKEPPGGGGGEPPSGGGNGTAQNNSIFNISLIKGWNLISLPSLTPEDINQTISPIKDDVDSIFAYKSNDTGFEWKSYYPLRSGLLNTLTIFEPFFGYWIKVNKNTTLPIYDPVC